MARGGDSSDAAGAPEVRFAPAPRAVPAETPLRVLACAVADGIVTEDDVALGLVDADDVRGAAERGLFRLQAGDLVLHRPLAFPRGAGHAAVRDALASQGARRAFLYGDGRAVLEVARLADAPRPVAAAPSWDAVPPDGRELLVRVARAAAARGETAWLVGGAVRDLLLGRPVGDLDLAVEGDAPALAQDVAAGSAGALERSAVHARFGTATLAGAGGRRIDLASTRRERYAHPGALPAVEPGTIEDDLRRRDFTANSLAAELRPDGFGRTLDAGGGLADLRAARLRVHHPLSFLDDPTRIFRAARFAHRLGFEIDPGTLRLARRAAHGGYVALLSDTREAREWTRAFGEPGWTGALRWIERCGLLDALDPGLGPWGVDWPGLEDAEELLRSYVRAPGPTRVRPEQLPQLLLLHGAHAAATGRVGRRLGAGPAVGAALHGLAARVAALEDGLGEPSRHGPGRILTACRDQPDLVLLAAAALSGQLHVRRAVDLWFRRLRAVRPRIEAGDLLRAGVPRGPEIRRALRAAAVARADRPDLGRAEELAEALRALGRG